MFDENDLRAVQQRLGHTFANRQLLEVALTHSTWIEEEYPGGHASAHMHGCQQRMEFLGDALLNYVVGRWLYEALPTADEGELTKRRTSFTKGEWLGARGADLGVGPLVRRGTGERMNASLNRNLPGDTVEALIGAVALDGGDAVAEALVRSWLPGELPSFVEVDPIVRMNEWHLKTYKEPPKNPDWTWTGPDNARTWTGSLEIAGEAATASGPSKAEVKRALMAELALRLRIDEQDE